MLIACSVLAVLAVLVPAAPADAHAARPSTYVVSRTPGTTLEGSTVTADGTMYVTSFGTGAVFRGNVRDPLLHPFVPAGSGGRHKAAGVHVDRYGRVFVAGFDNGTLSVYSRDGHLLLTRLARPSAHLNDFVFSKDAVYVTDSGKGIVWRAALDGRSVGPLLPWLTPRRFAPAPGYLNGIVLADDARVLLVADQDENVTYRVDVAQRVARPIVVSGADRTFSADGMLLTGHDVYGVYNYGPSAAAATYVVRHIHLSADYTHADVVADSDPEGAMQTPTTLAHDGHRLLWVNSQLTFAPGTPPFTVTEVSGMDYDAGR